MNIYNDILFFKIIRNLYIRNIIFKYLRLYNNLYKYSRLTYYNNSNKVKSIYQPYRQYITYLNLVSLQDLNGISLVAIKYYFENLEVLYLPSAFNQIIKSSDFGSKLKSIIFGDEFTNESFSYDNCNGQNVLPEGIESVEFGFRFNKEIGRGSLPSTLKSLVMGYSWCLNGDKLVLPEGLEVLKFGRGFERSLNYTFKLPSTLKSLVIKSNITIEQDILPHGLKELRLLDKFNSDIKSSKVLPSTLELLEIGHCFKDKDLTLVLKSLKSLKVLKIGDEYNYKIKKGSLPDTLTQLEISNLIYHLDPDTLPNSIKKVYIKDSFYNNSSTTSTTSLLVPGSLPTNLIEFNMGHYFNLPIQSNLLPSTLKSLVFSDNYTLKLLNGSIPESIESLEINNSICLNNDTLVNNSNLVNLKINYMSINNDQDIQFPVNSSKLKSFESNSPLKRVVPDSVETVITRLPITIQYLQVNSIVKLVIKGDPLNNVRSASTTTTTTTFNDNFDLKIIQLPSTIKHLELLDTRVTITNFKLVNFKGLINLEVLVIKRAVIVQVNNQLLPNSIKKLKLIQIKGLNSIDLSDFTNLTSLEITSPYSTIEFHEESSIYHKLESVNLPSQLNELILNINTLPVSSTNDKAPKPVFCWSQPLEYRVLQNKKLQTYPPLIPNLPESLTTLVYKCYYSVINEDIMLPSSIINLTLSSRFIQKNHHDKLINFTSSKSIQVLSIYYNGYLDFYLSDDFNLDNIIINFIKND